jgi:hypothetical protein
VPIKKQIKKTQNFSNDIITLFENLTSF